MSTAQVNGTAEAAATVVKALVWELKAEELLTYVCVTILALIPIYIGCHMSLTQKKEQVRDMVWSLCGNVREEGLEMCLCDCADALIFCFVEGRL